MAHYAKVVDGIVTNVIVAEAEFFTSGFADTSPGDWIQTSYNTVEGKHWDRNTHTLSADQSKALRKNFAAVGFTYDKVRDAFIPPKPFPSWILNEETCQWYAPIPDPADAADGVLYKWDEENQQFIDRWDPREHS